MTIPENLLQPSITFFGIVVNEPVTMFSDFLISIFCAFAFVSIKNNTSLSRNKTVILAFFFCMFFSTFLGGLLGHGLQYYLSPDWKIPSWIAGVLAVVLFQVIAANQLKFATNSSFYSFLNALNLFTFLVTIYFIFILRIFTWVQFHAVFGVLAVVLPVQIFMWKKHKSASSINMLKGISFAVFAAIIHLLQLGLGKWFNHLDTSHIVLVVSNYYLFRGMKSLLEEETLSITKPQ